MKLFLRLILMALCLQLSIQSHGAVTKLNANIQKVFATVANTANPTMDYSYQVIVEGITITVTSTKDRAVGKNKFAGSLVLSVSKKKFVNPQSNKMLEVGTLRFNFLATDVFEITNRKGESVVILVVSTKTKVRKSNGKIGNKPVAYEKYISKVSIIHDYSFYKKTKTHTFEISESLEKKPKGYPALFEACVSSFSYNETH